MLVVASQKNGGIRIRLIEAFQSFTRRRGGRGENRCFFLRRLRALRVSPVFALEGQTCERIAEQSS
jgi:hypothetical protein